MIPIVWLGTAALLNVIALWVIRRGRGVDHATSLPVWMRVLAGAASLAISGAITWWAFDVSGFVESQRLAAAGDYSAAVRAWKPPIPQDATFSVMVVLGLLATVGMGVHMALNPRFWAAIIAGDKPVADATLTRFRVYGYVITVLLVVAIVGLVWAWVSAAHI